MPTCARTADRLLHRVAHVVLPVEPVGAPLLGIPLAMIGNQIIEETDRESAVSGHPQPLKDGVGQPLAVPVQPRLRSAGGSPQPPEQIIVLELGITQPAALHEVMTEGTAHRIGPVDELGEHVTRSRRAAAPIRRPPQVFPQRPPAKVIDLLHLAVGALEERDVGREPGGGRRVRHQIDDRFVLEGVETRDVTRK